GAPAPEVPGDHVAAAAAERGVRGDDGAARELPGVRRGARDDAGRAGQGDDAVRVRHLRARVREPARGEGQRAHGGVLRGAARRHGPPAPRVARRRPEAGSSHGGAVKERGWLWRRIAPDGVLVLVALLWLGPYLWMTLTSFKTLPEIVHAPLAPL